jgi:hypothetical protein
MQDQEDQDEQERGVRQWAAALHEHQHQQPEHGQ